MPPMRIIRSGASQLPLFESMWHGAAAYMQAIGVPAWTTFPSTIIASDIADSRHFMGVLPDGACAGYFSVTWRDEAIWQERDCDDALYIHRMCGNVALPGSGFARQVFEWAQVYGFGARRTFLRMDTWAENHRLIAYYERCGFVRVGTRDILSEPALPPHYQGISLALFENRLRRPKAHRGTS